LDDFHTARTQLLQQLAEVVDPVVDHEGRFACKALILGLIGRPFEDSAALSPLLLKKTPPTPVIFAIVALLPI